MTEANLLDILQYKKLERKINKIEIPSGQYLGRSLSP